MAERGLTLPGVRTEIRNGHFDFTDITLFSARVADSRERSESGDFTSEG